MKHRVTALFAIAALGASLAAWSKCSVVRPLTVKKGVCTATWVPAQPGDGAHWALGCSSDSVGTDGGCSSSDSSTKYCYQLPAKKTMDLNKNAVACTIAFDANGNPIVGGTCSSFRPPQTYTANCHYGYPSSDSCLGVSETTQPAGPAN